MIYWVSTGVYDDLVCFFPNLAVPTVGRTKFKVYSDREKTKTGATVDGS